MKPQLTYLALGSNLGDRHALIRQALLLLEERVGHIAALSSLIETEPWGFESPHPFINGVVALRTLLSPRDLLFATQQIERELGRQQKSVHQDTSQASTSVPTGSVLPRYADRPIDIDILSYADAQLDLDLVDEEGNSHHLTIPHPLMQQRDFVMRPLREIS